MSDERNLTERTMVQWATTDSLTKNDNSLETVESVVWNLNILMIKSSSALSVDINCMAIDFYSI